VGAQWLPAPALHGPAPPCTTLPPPCTTLPPPCTTLPRPRTTRPTPRTTRPTPGTPGHSPTRPARARGLRNRGLPHRCPRLGWFRWPGHPSVRLCRTPPSRTGRPLRCSLHPAPFTLLPSPCSLHPAHFTLLPSPRPRNRHRDHRNRSRCRGPRELGRVGRSSRSAPVLTLSCRTSGRPQGELPTTGLLTLKLPRTAFGDTVALADRSRRPGPFSVRCSAGCSTCCWLRLTPWGLAARARLQRRRNLRSPGRGWSWSPSCLRQKSLPGSDTTCGCPVSGVVAANGHRSVAAGRRVDAHDHKRTRPHPSR